MKELTEDLLGLAVSELGEPNNEASCARTLVQLCRQQSAIEALVDAIRAHGYTLERILRRGSLLGQTQALQSSDLEHHMDLIARPQHT